jgi:hypothetical protein
MGAESVTVFGGAAGIPAMLIVVVPRMTAMAPALMALLTCVVRAVVLAPWSMSTILPALLAGKWAAVAPVPASTTSPLTGLAPGGRVVGEADARMLCESCPRADRQPCSVGTERRPVGGERMARCRVP